MIEPKNIQGKSFAPVGCCIYCGSDGGAAGLRKEHIVPFSLGGKATLPAASCAECEKITSYLDGYLARDVYGHFRIHAGVQTRNRKARPTVLPATVVFSDREEKRMFPVPEHPYHTALPVFGLPGILRHKEPSDTFGEWKAVVLYSHPDNLAETLSIEPGVPARIKMSGDINLAVFARALAKIAHAHTVAREGISGFVPYLPELIVGRNLNIPHFVGGVFEDPPPPGPPDLLHEIGFEEWGNQDHNHLVVRMRLFSNSGTDEHGMPIYYCVVGRLHKTMTPQPRAASFHKSPSATSDRRHERAKLYMIMCSYRI